MNANQIDVLQWWYNDRDYQQGVMMLGRYGKNQVLAASLNKPGKEKFGGRRKLEYELPKAVGLNWVKMPALPEGIAITPNPGIQHNNNVLANEPTEDQIRSADMKHVPLLTDKPIDQYPKVIRRLKYEYSNYYTERSIKHKKMLAVPEENSVKNMTERAQLLADIHRISATMDRLYGFINDYIKNNVLPKAEDIWPETKPEKKYELPDGIEELKKLKKNLQTNNTKDRNRLLYQSRSKTAKENPMAPGPKRLKYEQNINKRDKEILAIDTKIVELGQ